MVYYIKIACECRGQLINYILHFVILIPIFP